MRATAASYVISPAALAAVAARPGPARPTSCRRAGCWPSPPGWSATSGRSSPARPGRASASPRSRIDGEVRFASAADRAAFAEELADAVTALVGKYHDETAEGGRDHRLVVAVHPSYRRKPRSD